MNLVMVYISKDCATCQSVIDSIKPIVNKFYKFSFKIVDISRQELSISIVPAIFINDELYCYGQVDKKKFYDKLKFTSQK